MLYRGVVGEIASASDGTELGVKPSAVPRADADLRREIHDSVFPLLAVARIALSMGDVAATDTHLMQAGDLLRDLLHTDPDDTH